MNKITRNTYARNDPGEDQDKDEGDTSYGWAKYFEREKTGREYGIYPSRGIYEEA